jgi:phage terminase large subunit
VSTARIELPPKLIPVFAAPNKRYRGAWGGRGSAKTRSFAKMTAVKAYMFAQSGVSGIILCGREYMNTLADSSMAEVKAAIESEPWLAAHFDIGETYIRTKDKRVEYVFIGLHHNLNSIKSKARILLAWIDEAEPVTEEAWQKLIPTVREDDSEIWLTWNKERKAAPTNQRFGDMQDDDAIIVEMNWRDNPWFPDVLEKERLRDLRDRPEQYDHIWEGKYKTAIEGAYFARHLVTAREDGRITSLSPDPLFVIRLHCDIGGTGQRADAFTIWADQFIGQRINFLNYYESRGQPLGHHLDWMRSQGYTKDRAEIILPHDGDSNDKVYDISYKSAFEQVGYTVTVVPNQGAGAAKQRIEAMRRLFPRMYFDEKKTEAGREALGWYHEKIDPERSIGLGPDHDWSSHGADSAGLAAITYEEPVSYASIRVPIDTSYVV